MIRRARRWLTWLATRADIIAEAETIKVGFTW